jgi:hypothetical protein
MDGIPYLRAVPLTTNGDGYQEISFLFNSGPIDYIVVNIDAWGAQGVRIDDLSVTEEASAPQEQPTLSGYMSGNTASLSWDPYPGATEYIIWRAVTAWEFPHEFKRVSGTSFQDPDLISGMEYSYQIAVEESPQSFIFSYQKLYLTAE